ncbi:MAG: sulfite exporter TauE/SafE family protein [Desulfococcaceae bacterium]
MPSSNIMETQTIITAFSAFFIASFLKGLTGLGFATLCLGFLALFMDLKQAIPLVFLPSLSSNLMVMVDAGRFVEAFKRFWILYLGALPGLGFGMVFLAQSRNEIPKGILGAVIFLYGLWGLKGGRFRLSETRERQLLLPIGLASGLVNGATGSQIMPLMPYLLSLNMDRDLFIQTINCSFTINTVFLMAGLGTLGILTAPIMVLSIGGILPVAVGLYLGGRIRRKTTEEVYRKMVLALLIGIGGSLVARLFL